MKKIKYLTQNHKKAQPKASQIDNLKEDDEICGAVLDTMNEDYLSYISNLVKNSKTQAKSKNVDRQRAQAKNESSNEESDNQDIMNMPTREKKVDQDNRQRHHSEMSENKSLYTGFSIKVDKPNLIINSKSKSMAEKMVAVDKLAIQNTPETLKLTNKAQNRNIKNFQTKKAVTNQHQDIKKYQKTLAFTQNYHQISKKKNQKAPLALISQTFQFDRSKDGTAKQKQKYPFKPKKIKNNFFQDQLKDDQPSVSIDRHCNSNQYPVQSQSYEVRQRLQKSESSNSKFINNIDEYLNQLQSTSIQSKDRPYKIHQNQKIRDYNQQKTVMYEENTVFKKSGNRKMSESFVKNRDKHYFYAQQEQQRNQPSFSRDQIQQIIQENQKLHKRLKNYKQKIEEIEEQMSNHQNGYKLRQKKNNAKISSLILALTQAQSKITSQKEQIASLRELLSSFSKECRKIEQTNLDALQSDDLSQQIDRQIIQRFRQSTKKQNCKQSRTFSDRKFKNKKAFQSTMPKNQDEPTKFW